MNAPPIPLLVIGSDQETLVVLEEALRHARIENHSVARLAAACQPIDQERVLTVLVDLDETTQHERWLLDRKTRQAGVGVFAVGTNRPTIFHKGWVFVRKPYHFRDLIHKIRCNLGSSLPGRQAAA